MFKYLEKIEAIKDFSLYKSELIYLTKDCKIPQAPTLEITDIVTNAKYPGDLFLIQNLLFWQDMYGKCLVYDLQDESLLFANIKNDQIYTFRRIDLLQMGLLSVNRRVDGRKELCYFDLNEKEFIPSKGEISVSLNGGDITLDIRNDFLEIHRLSLEGKNFWKLSLSKSYLDNRKEYLKEEFRSVIGSYHDSLWLSLNSGRVIAISLDKGSLEHQIGFRESDLPQFPFEVKEGDYLPFGELMQLDEDKGEIIGLRDKYFMKVDLNQSEPRRKYIDVGQSMAAHKISSSYRNYSFPIDEQFIYFCDDRQGKIGVFDREKKEVIWSYELDMERDGIAQILEMKYANNRWYVLDRNDTLHIFERTT